MSNSVELACTFCGSTNIVSVDVVTVEAAISGWTRSDAGAFEPKHSGSSEAFWDTQSTANEAQPYSCKGCDEALGLGDLVLLSPEGEHLGPAAPALRGDPPAASTGVSVAAMDPAVERDLLANAIRDAAIAAGIARDDAPMTGPMLLMLCHDMATDISNSRALIAAPDAYWPYLEVAFNNSKTSASEQVLCGLGLPMDHPEKPLSWHVARAMERDRRAAAPAAG